MTVFFSFALALLLQSTLLLTLGLVASWLLRRRGPALRAFVLQMTLAGVVLGALFSALAAGHVQPVWSVQMPTVKEPTSLLARSSTRGFLPKREDEEGKMAAVGSNAAQGSKSQTFTSALVSLWLVGSGAGLLWLAMCQMYLGRLRQRSKPISDADIVETTARLNVLMGGARTPLLLATPGIASPFLAGLWRPTIFLPTHWRTEYNAQALRVILAHELAHYRRRDCAWHLLLRLTTALLWPQPLLWILGRALEQAAEETCDLMALAPDCPPRRYADCLLTLAERTLPTRLERSLGEGVTPTRSALGRRIQNILAGKELTMKPLSPRLRAAIAAGIIAAALGVLGIVSANSPSRQDTQRAQAYQITSVSNLRQIGLAFIVYAQNHNGRLPDADRWIDELTPILVQGSQSQEAAQERIKLLFHDPGAPDGNVWSYAFNRALSGVSLSSLKDPAHVVMLFESTQGIKNANGFGKTLPNPGWHDIEVDVCCADGRVESLTYSHITSNLTFEPSDRNAAKSHPTYQKVSNIVDLQQSLEQAQQNYQVAKTSAATYLRLARAVGPTQVLRLDPASRPQVVNLGMDIAALKGHIKALRGVSTSSNPKLISLEKELNAKEDERKQLLRMPYVSAIPSAEYIALHRQMDQAIAQTARAQTLIASIRSQIAQLSSQNDSTANSSRSKAIR